MTASAPTGRVIPMATLRPVPSYAVVLHSAHTCRLKRSSCHPKAVRKPLVRYQGTTADRAAVTPERVRPKVLRTSAMLRSSSSKQIHVTSISATRASTDLQNFRSTESGFRRADRLASQLHVTLVCNCDGHF